MYCPHCGMKCADSHRFCLHCGMPLPTPEAIQALMAQAPAAAEWAAPETAEAAEAAEAEAAADFVEETQPVDEAAGEPPVAEEAAYWEDAPEWEETSAELPPEWEQAPPPPQETPTAVPVPPSPRKKGRLWPPLVILAAMICVGLLVFGLSHLGDVPGFANGDSSDASEYAYFRVKKGTLYFNKAYYTGGDALTVPSTVDGQTVTAISDGCFAQCDNLTTVILPDTIEVIGEQAFAQCTAMRGIYLPESVKSIGHSAFLGCSALESISIPSSVEEVGSSVFLRCQSLRHIFYGGTSQQWMALEVDTIDLRVSVYCEDGTLKQEQ